MDSSAQSHCLCSSFILRSENRLRSMIAFKTRSCSGVPGAPTLMLSTLASRSSLASEAKRTSEWDTDVRVANLHRTVRVVALPYRKAPARGTEFVCEVLRGKEVGEVAVDVVPVLQVLTLTQLPTIEINASLTHGAPSSYSISGMSLSS